MVENQSKKTIQPVQKIQGKQDQGKGLHLEIVTQILALATSSLGLVAALAWNSFIQELVNDYIKKYLPRNSGLISLFIYALVVTILAVVVTLNLSKVKEKLEE